MDHKQFEDMALEVMSTYCNAQLQPGTIHNVPKKFDMVSNDGNIVADAKYYSMVNGSKIPPAKFSVIAEYIWMMQQTDAKYKAMVFGNDRRVPMEWLKRYGHMVKDVAFIFIEDDGTLEILKGIE